MTPREGVALALGLALVALGWVLDARRGAVVLGDEREAALESGRSERALAPVDLADREAFTPPAGPSAPPPTGVREALAGGSRAPTTSPSDALPEEGLHVHAVTAGGEDAADAAIGLWVAGGRSWLAHASTDERGRARLVAQPGGAGVDSRYELGLAAPGAPRVSLEGLEGGASEEAPLRLVLPDCGTLVVSLQGTRLESVTSVSIEIAARRPTETDPGAAAAPFVADYLHSVPSGGTLTLEWMPAGVPFEVRARGPGDLRSGACEVLYADVVPLAAGSRREFTWRAEPPSWTFDLLDVDGAPLAHRAGELAAHGADRPLWTARFRTDALGRASIPRRDAGALPVQFRRERSWARARKGGSRSRARA